MPVQKIAVWLLVAGFAFTFFSLPFMGIDLLLDPVGFLLLFNGAKALARFVRGFLPAAYLALGLCVLACVQLFLSGGAAQGLGIARAVLVAALCLFLARGFARLLLPGHKGPAWLAAGMFVLLAAATALGLSSVPFVAPLLMFSQILALGLLALLALAPRLLKE